MPMGKASLFIEPYHFELTELPTPPVEPGGILVNITSAGICGSDLHYWRGELKPRVSGQPGPVILGHEMSGVVHTLGADITTDSMGRPLKEGDRVAFTYFFPCRRCYICLRGELNNCPNRFRFKASVEESPYCSGGFAEYFYLNPGHFVFVVLELVGYAHVVPEGLQMLRPGGTFVEIGNIATDSNVTLDMSKILWGITKIIPTAHYDPYTLPVALDFLVQTKDKYPLTNVMSHAFPLEQIDEAFQKAEWAGSSEERSGSGNLNRGISGIAA